MTVRSDAPFFALGAGLQIEIDPLESGMRYWAFVSIANNETQRVTLVTPQ